MTEETTATSEPLSDDALQSSVANLLEDPKPETKAEPQAQTVELETDKTEETHTAEPEEKQSKQLAPEVQESINKRIAKEVHKRKALESALEAEIKKREHLETKVVEPSEDNKTPSDLSEMTSEQLGKADQEAREYMVWASNGPLTDGYEASDSNGETKYFSPEEIQETYNHFNKRVLLEIPQAKQEKQNLVNKLNAVAVANPVLQDQESEEYKTYSQVWTSKDYATLRSHPNGPEMCWLIVKGLIQKGSAPKLAPPVELPKTAPKVPVVPAPGRAKLISKQPKVNTALSEADYQAASEGDLESAISKLITN